MTGIWVDAVADKVSEDRDDVADVLSAYGIAGPRPVPSRRQLRVEALHFAGVKNLQSDVDADQRHFVPFSFAHDFSTAVTALVSDGKNDAGKSSTLDILKWSLRGRSSLSSDVRQWLRQVCVVLTINGERVLIWWTVQDALIRGAILTIGKLDVSLDGLSAAAMNAMKEQAQTAGEANTPLYDGDFPIEDVDATLRAAGAYRVAGFTNEEEMERAISEFMLDRLGLAAISQWRLNAHALDADDGSTAEHGWPLWFQALVITKPSIVSVIGETPMQAIAVLNTFLATEWSGTKTLAKARKGEVDAQLAGLRRRAAKDAEARESSVATLSGELAALQAELANLPATTLTKDEAEARVSKVAVAGADVTRTARELATVSLTYGNAEKALESAQLDLAALKESAVTKRFWHSLKPSCCPRCDAQVEQEQWAREQEGSCSLCNSPIEEAAALDQPEEGEEDADVVALAQQRVDACEAKAISLSALEDEARLAARAAEAAFTAAIAAVEEVQGDPHHRHTLERQISMLEGRILERRDGGAGEAIDITALERHAEILTAAIAVAGDAAKKDLDVALQRVSAQVTDLGKALGIDNLESAQLKGNAQLPVVRGGTRTPFGGLTDGERLRLKVAVVVALLDVGADSGLGRHPGFLIIDSLLREELNEENGKLLLSEIVRVATQFGLQVVTGTAHSDLVDSVLPDEAVVRPLATGFLW